MKMKRKKKYEKILRKKNPKKYGKNEKDKLKERMKK